VSRETLDAEGAGQPLPGVGEPAGPAVDHDLDDLPPAAAVPRAAPGPLPAPGPGRDARPGEDGDLPLQDGLDSQDGGQDGQDGFAADLGEDRTDPRAAARLPGERLTALDRRRIRLAALAVGAVLLLVLAAVGGYSEGQKAQARDALATARVVGHVDESALNFERTDQGDPVEPLRMTLHLTISASVTATVTRLVLPLGEVRPQGRVVLGPGAGTDARFELRNLCDARSRSLTDTGPTTATLRTADGAEVTVPLLLGLEKQLFSRSGLCVSSGDPQVPLEVSAMTARRDGVLDIALQSRDGRDRQVVAVVSSNLAATGQYPWRVEQLGGGPVTVPGDGIASLQLRLVAPDCPEDRTLPPVSDLVAFRVTESGAAPTDGEVDGTLLANWDEVTVTAAAAAAMARACRG
jgi:hypothetical protein